jgi:hypothetical protein
VFKKTLKRVVERNTGYLADRDAANSPGEISNGMTSQVEDLSNWTLPAGLRRLATARKIGLLCDANLCSSRNTFLRLSLLNIVQHISFRDRNTGIAKGTLAVRNRKLMLASSYAKAMVGAPVAHRATIYTLSCAHHGWCKSRNFPTTTARYATAAVELFTPEHVETWVQLLNLLSGSHWLRSTLANNKSTPPQHSDW